VWSGPVQALPQDGNYRSLVVLKLPDARPRQLALTGLLLPTFVLDEHAGPTSVFPDLARPRLALTAFAAAPGQDGLGANTGLAQSVFAVDTSKLTQLTGDGGAKLRILLAPEQGSELPGGLGTVTFDGVKRYAVLDVRHDPSRLPALVSALLALAGLTASLFVRRRRVWLRARTDGAGRTVVAVAGLARGEDAGLDREVAAVLAAVQAALVGSEVVVAEGVSA